VPELVDDPHVTARGLIAEAVHDTRGPFRQLGTVLAGTDTARHHFRVRDGAVTDTDELLADAGLTTDEITALREGGVVA
jgi:crotonobetainyl-CoA:carnitine CoA-transferase CaiB-like acyl-CoA transferase